MTDITETSQTVAAGQLRSFFERWQRLEEEKQTISDDLKELFAEAKGVGFDTKAMRAVFRDRMKDQAEMQEAASVYDLYWAALDQPRVAPARPARSARENIEEFPPHDAETGEIIEQNSSDLTSSPETTDTARAEPPPSALATNSNSVAGPAPQAQPATVEAGADPLAAPADNSEKPDHATSGAADGRPSKPSSEAARAKNDGPQNTVIGQEGPVRGHSEQAVTISDADVPAFLMKPPSPAPNPDCQKPQSCRWSHSQASCAKCANDAAIARQRGRAA